MCTADKVSVLLRVFLQWKVSVRFHREREKRGQISVWISKETQTLYLNSERNEKQNKQKQLFIPRKSFSFLNQTKMYNFVYVSCLLYTKSSNALIPFDFNTSKVKVTQFWKELYHFRFPLLYRKWLLIINRNITQRFLDFLLLLGFLLHNPFFLKVKLMPFSFCLLKVGKRETV